jgi:hypothetical protein
MPDFGDLKQMLTRKVGPLPVWAWGGIGVTGIAAYRYRKARALGETAFTPGPTPDVGAPEPGYGPDAGFVPISPVLGSVASPSTFDTGISAPEGATTLHPSALEFRRGVITGRIRELQRGGVTRQERYRIQNLRARRRSLRAG